MNGAGLGGTGTVMGLILLVAAYIAARAVAGLVSKEATGWAPHIGVNIVRRASRRLPEEHRERWLEEMEADIAQFGDRPLSALAHAILAAHGTRRLARELRPSAVASGVDGAESAHSGVPPRGHRAAGKASISVLLAAVERYRSWLAPLGRAIGRTKRVYRLTVYFALIALAEGITLGTAKHTSVWNDLLVGGTAALTLALPILMVVRHLVGRRRR